MENERMEKENTCLFCGQPLSRYGNRKILDGYLCRDCIKPASPWLNDDDYEKMSLEDFKNHLAYREANKDALEAFKEEKKVEGKYSLYLDEEKRQFLISKRKDYLKENADVFPIEQIRELSIFEDKFEDSEDVDLCFDLKLDNEQIDNVCFRVNEFPGLEKDSEQYEDALKLAFAYLNAFEEVDGIDFEQVEGE